MWITLPSSLFPLALLSILHPKLEPGVNSVGSTLGIFGFLAIIFGDNP